MNFISDEELAQFVKEDSPYGDLTTWLQNPKETQARFKIYTREKIIVSAMDEVVRIAKLFGIEVVYAKASREIANEGETLLELKGEYIKLHQIWRSVQKLLEYSSKIATTTYKMVSLMKEVNPHCELLATRKTIPFAKHLCMRGVLDGGGLPHRLGLSETILFFPQHRILYKDFNEFLKAIKGVQLRSPEKRVAVESETFEEAKELLDAGIELLQIDKADPEILKKIVDYKNSNDAKAYILASGGIGLSNVKEYASSGVNGIVTSKIYCQGMVNLGSLMEKI